MPWQPRQTGGLRDAEARCSGGLVEASQDTRFTLLQAHPLSRYLARQQNLRVCKQGRKADFKLSTRISRQPSAKCIQCGEPMHAPKHEYAQLLISDGASEWRKADSRFFHDYRTFFMKTEYVYDLWELSPVKLHALEFQREVAYPKDHHAIAGEPSTELESWPELRCARSSIVL